MTILHTNLELYFKCRTSILDRKSFEDMDIRWKTNSLEVSHLFLSHGCSWRPMLVDQSNHLYCSLCTMLT